MPNVFLRSSRSADHGVDVCEMPRRIDYQNEPAATQQVPHGKPTLSLITAVSCSREAPLFVLG